MNHILRATLVLIIPFFYACKTTTQECHNLQLWYDKPAADWMKEALPIGNGYMGAMFFGGVEKEQIQFTEGSLWAGGPGLETAYKYGIKKEAWKHLSEIRELLDAGKIKEAHALASQELTGISEERKEILKTGTFGAQQTMGDLFIDVKHKGEVEDYKRTLDLKNGEGKLSYTIDGNAYNRTYFGNYPSKIMLYSFDSECATDYEIEYKSPHIKLSESFTDDVYAYTGKVSYGGMEYETCIRFDTDGDLSFSEGVIKVANAKKLVLYHTASTDYLMKYPYYKGNDYKVSNKLTLSKLQGNSYEEIQKEHLQDYQTLFTAVQLDLGKSHRSNISTNVRLVDYNKGITDPDLEELFFQYGRYLMISGSRPGAMPLNLQGKWNNSTTPAWACDYHMNINLQMIYWPAEVTNLHECHLPLFDFMESLVEPGSNSAKEFFNAQGWIVNTMCNAFGYTSPGWMFPWGFFPGGAAWLCQHAWEHYDFTRDEDFLRETAFPLMKAASLFWMDYLNEDENGLLVSSPSYSPEHGGISRGASLDHQLAWDLLNNCVQACGVLGIEEEFKQKATKIRDKIFPPTIGRWGQLQEWKEDVDDPKSVHRHVSHLFALHPGKQITMKKTPKLAEAARVSLNARGDAGTGWSLAWKVNFWARLKDGNRAYKLLGKLLQPKGLSGVKDTRGGGTYPNMFSTHPPFQLDGNMGATAGIAEMLIQSHEENTIRLLPALPEVWKTGHVKGLKARGAYEVDMEWKDGELLTAQIKSLKGGSPNVVYNNKTIKPELKVGEIYKIKD